MKRKWAYFGRWRVNYVVIFQHLSYNFLRKNLIPRDIDKRLIIYFVCNKRD